MVRWNGAAPKIPSAAAPSTASQHHKRWLAGPQQASEQGRRPRPRETATHTPPAPQAAQAQPHRDVDNSHAHTAPALHKPNHYIQKVLFNAGQRHPLLAMGGWGSSAASMRNGCQNGGSMHHHHAPPWRVHRMMQCP